MRRLHPLDSLLINLLGQQGLIKREALKHLNDKVYRLPPKRSNSLNKKNYAQVKKPKKLTLNNFLNINVKYSSLSSTMS